MKILVSACLTGRNCKYNGGNNRNEALLQYLEGHEVVAVCPETLGGLPTPRIPSEIVKGVVTTADGTVVDREFREGARKALELALVEKVELAILQPRSPSCGARQIYDGSFEKKLIPGKGVFASMLASAGIPCMEPEDVPTGEYKKKDPLTASSKAICPVKGDPV